MFDKVIEWIKELWHIYAMEYYAAGRKKELLSFETARMELETIMLSEISQVMKDKYHMISTSFYKGCPWKSHFRKEFFF